MDSSRGSPFLALTCLMSHRTHTQAALYLREPQRYLDRLQRIYQTAMAERPTIRLMVEQMAAVETLPAENEDVRETRQNARLTFQLGNRLIIFVRSGLNRAIRRFDGDPALSDDMHEMCDEVIYMSRSCNSFRPFGSFFVPQS